LVAEATLSLMVLEKKLRERAETRFKLGQDRSE